MLHSQGFSKASADLTCRNGDKLTWTIELIPEQAKNNFNHWVGLMVHKGTIFWRPADLLFPVAIDFSPTILHSNFTWCAGLGSFVLFR